ncbi:MAG: hypothetical protein WBN72_10955 [Nitrososphaeraceae archaeon]
MWAQGDLNLASKWVQGTCIILFGLVHRIKCRLDVGSVGCNTLVYVIDF